MPYSGRLRRRALRVPGVMSWCLWLPVMGWMGLIFVLSSRENLHFARSRSSTSSSASSATLWSSVPSRCSCDGRSG